MLNSVFLRREQHSGEARPARAAGNPFGWRGKYAPGRHLQRENLLIMIPRQNGHLNLGYGNTKTNTVAPWIEELARGLVPGWFPLTCTEGVRSGTAAPAPPRSSLLRSREQAALAALAGLLGDSLCLGICPESRGERGEGCPDGPELLGSAQWLCGLSKSNKGSHQYLPHQHSEEQHEPLDGETGQ